MLTWALKAGERQLKIEIDERDGWEGKQKAIRQECLRSQLPTHNYER